MRSSTWRALGNTYVLVEPGAAALDSSRARELSASTDGVVEVVWADDDRLTACIWNRDGSLAELSGNGTRIAAAWLAERSGAEEVTVSVGIRLIETTLSESGEIEQLIG